MPAPMFAQRPSQRLRLAQLVQGARSGFITETVPDGVEVSAATFTSRSSPQWLSDATGAARLLDVSYTPASRIIFGRSRSVVAGPGNYEYDSPTSCLGGSTRIVHSRSEGTACESSARFFDGTTSR